MKFIAAHADSALLMLFFFTVTVAVFKGFDLWATRLVRGRPLRQFLGNTQEELDRALEKLALGMTTLATIASTAPFLGLAATVIHISEALRTLSGGQVDAAVLAGPVADALMATLAGIACAVPAAVAYNLYNARLGHIERAHVRQLGCLQGES